jgi:hypothetical protein
MSALTASLLAFTLAAAEDWTGLPPDLSLAEAAEVLTFEATDLQWGRSGDPAITRNWIPAASSVYAGGLRLWVEGPRVIALEGIHPLAASGGFTSAPVIGEPNARLTTRLGALVLQGGELVYAARGLAVRVNPDNGFLLGLIGFAPTTAANYCSRIRPAQSRPVRLRAGVSE